MMERITVSLKDSQFEALRQMSITENISIAELIRTAIAKMIDEDLSKRVEALEKRVEALEKK